MHVLASIIVEYVPDAHRLHAPPEENAPMVHKLHTDEPAPTVDDPALQAVHSVAAVSAANVPTGQRLHEDIPDPEYIPS